MANNQTVTNKQSTFKNDSNDDYVVETEDQGSGVQRQVVKVADTALPTDAATETKQDTIIGHVDGIETTLTSIDGKDFATQTTLAAAEVHLGNIDSDTGTISTNTTDIADAVDRSGGPVNNTVQVGGKDGSGNLRTLNTNTEGTLQVDVLTSSNPGDNVVNAANSSTSTLAASATFTGSWVDVTQYDSVVIAVKTDQDGTFAVEFSPDATNIDSTLTRYYRTSQIEAPHRFTITRQYCRVTFTNTSASTQTFFRLQTTFGTHTELNAPMDSTLAQDFDSTVVRPTDYHYEVALGRRQGGSTWNKFGYNDDVDSAASETIWSVGGTHARMTSADTLDVVSSSTSDTSAGTGAQTVLIYGVDENWDIQTETVTMNGTTTVTTTNQWFGIDRVAITSAGSGDVNAGTITVSATTAATTQAAIPAGEGVTQQAIFYVPQKYQFLTDWLFINVNKLSGGGSPRVTIKGWVYSDVASCKFEVFRKTIDTAVENTVEISPTQPFVIGEKSILYFEADTDTNNTIVSCRFSGILVRDIDG